MSSLIKPGYDDNRQILAAVIPLKTPFSVQIEASSVCNFRCKYCIHYSSEMKNQRVMEWSTFLKLCEQLKEFDDRLKQINVAGWGEPLVNKDLPRMISHIKKMNIAKNVAIITNGSLLKRDYALSLIAAGVDFIKISLQGMTADKYMKVSGVKIDFDEMVSNIEFLHNNKQNCQIYIKVADIALQEGEKELFYSTFSDITDRMYVESILPIFDFDSISGKDLSKKSMNKYGQLHSPVIVCPQPFYMMNVTAEGDVLPCCAYYDPTKLGNINEKSIKEIWNGKEMKLLLKMMLSKNRKVQNLYPVCRDCKIPDVVISPGDDLDLYADEVLKKYC
jgi:cyclic pyranopterin phosphate synthase